MSITKKPKWKPCPAKGKKRKPMPRKFKTEWGVRYPDGREICDKRTAAGRQEYACRRADMWMRDQGICCVCHKFVQFTQAEFEHRDGRGMNGSHRDDRIENNGIAHHDCNMEKGSKRLGIGE